MYKSNLSFKSLDLYLSELVQSGLVEEKLDEDLGRTYIATPRGLRFLTLLDHLRSFMEIAPPRRSELGNPLRVNL